jgi:hypothetical protein
MGLAGIDCEFHKSGEIQKAEGVLAASAILSFCQRVGISKKNGD